jgi:hypothetical protein
MQQIKIHESLPIYIFSHHSKGGNSGPSLGRKRILRVELTNTELLIARLPKILNKNVMSLCNIKIRGVIITQIERLKTMLQIMSQISRQYIGEKDSKLTYVIRISAQNVVSSSSIY